MILALYLPRVRYSDALGLWPTIDAIEYLRGHTVHFFLHVIGCGRESNSLEFGTQACGELR